MKHNSQKSPADGKRTDRRIIYRAVLFVMIGLLCLFVLSGFMHLASAGTYIDISENCTVTDSSGTYEKVSLSDFKIDHTVRRGETVTVKKVLPANIFHQSTLRILSYLSAVDVYLEDELIYTHGWDMMDIGRVVGSGYHFIDFDQRPPGKTIKVVFTAGDDNAFTNISPFYIYDTTAVYTNFASEKLTSMFIGIFLFILGIMVCAVSLILISREKRYVRMAYISMFSMMIGLWILCSSKAMQLFIADLTFNTVLEYAALYFAIVPFSALMIELLKERKLPRWKNILLDVNAILPAGFALTALVLQFTSVLHLCQLLPIFHIVVLTVIVLFLIVSKRPKGNFVPDSDRILHVAVLIMCIFAVLDLIRFNVQNYLFPSMHLFDASFLPFGALVFIVLLFLSTLFYFYELTVLQAKEDSLKRMAFEDPVTGLGNRAYSERIFRECSEGKRGDYIIINMDLNGLKRANDTHGHSVGDELIRRFAGVLTLAFPGEKFEKIRMGGDEFVVVCSEEENENVEKALRGLAEEEDRLSPGLPVRISAAWGVAHSSDLEEKEGGDNEEPSKISLSKAEKIYRIADKRMYAMKQKMKDGQR